jgi:hypothetical protein
MITKKGGTKFKETITKKRDNKNQEKAAKLKEIITRKGTTKTKKKMT